MHLDSATGDTGLYAMLYGDDAVSYDFVVLQDQSQIPGFPQTQSEWIQSRDAAVSLASIIEDRGGATRLFLTWGKRDGDPVNPDRFPDYTTMQALLLEGYTAYAEAIEDAGHAVEIVPVGLAWQIIHDDHLADAEDPLAESSLFHQLYAGDGSHPSRLGTYLSACVFYAALTGNSPVGLTWAPDTISESDRAALQSAADRLMFPVTEPGDTGDTGGRPDTDTSAPTETGTPDTGQTLPGAGDGGEDPVGSADDDARSDARSDAGAADKDGCACASARHGVHATSVLFVLAFVGLRRRAPRCDPRIAPRSHVA